MNTFILMFQILLILQTLDASCPNGEFGFKCQFRCGCKNDATCNPITGNCPNGCNQKFYGPNCLLFNPFIYDPHGRLYTGTMNRTESGKPCQSWNTLIFKRFFNYTGSQFADKFIPGAVCRNPNLSSKNKTTPWCFKNINTISEEKCYLSEGDCPDGRFGPNCVYECHCQNLWPCDKRTGKCKQCYDGWIGPSCQKKCAASKYGTDCKETCGKCKETLCDHETGQCLNGCNAGWKGNRCNTECPDGRFGVNCVYECHCQNLESCDKYKCEAGKYGTNCSETCWKCKDILCDHETGKCLNGCNAGWIGDLCNTRCPDGRFGVNCVYECHCRNHESCDKHTGKCTHCYDGWIGRACQQKCEAGKYGTNCKNMCWKCKDNFCDHETGHCLNGCNAGWGGYLCNTSFSDTSEKHSNSPWMVMSIVFGVILMVSILCLIIYCWLKRRGSSPKVPLESQYDDIGTVNDNSARVRALSNNVQEAETSVDGPAVEKVSHHLMSIELSTSSDDSVHDLSVSLLSGDGYEHPYQTIDPENIELHPYSTSESNIYQNTYSN